MIKKIISGLILILAVFSIAQSAQIQTVEQYKNSQPIVVPKTIPTMEQLKETDWSKYNKVLNMLTQENYGCIIRQASTKYGIDPVAIMGSVIAEHTYNVNAWDTFGERYLKMRKKWIDRFSGNGINLAEMLMEPAYASCEKQESDYFKWSCYDSVWRKDPRNVKGSNALKWTFFNPSGAGFTYGLGQMGPDRALMVTDVVHRYSGFPQLSLSNIEMIYDHILNPKISIHYVAASILVSIDIYKKYANFDISQNPGVIATLYNIGKEKTKADQKYKENLKSLNSGLGLVYPGTNDFGALVNYTQNNIREAYNQKIRPIPESSCTKHYAQP